MNRKPIEVKPHVAACGEVKISEVSTELSEEESPKKIRECPEDYLTPLDMVKYIRALEDGVEIPLDVAEHLQSCKACTATWGFLQATDPVFRKFRKQRVEALIHQLKKDEGFAKDESDQVANRQEEHEDSPQGNQENVIEAIAGKYAEEIHAEIEKRGDLPLDWLFEKCANVQRIEEVRARYLVANAFAQALHTMFFADVESRPNTREISRSIATAPSETFDFTELKEHQPQDLPKGLFSVVELGVALIMRFPAVSYFPLESILERSGSGVLFHREAFDRYRKEFEKLSKSDSVSPVHSRL